MDVMHPRCCGLDVHKKTVVACVLLSERRKVRKEIRTFGTMTADLQSLLDWLQTLGVTHLAMESTGVYWKPIYNLLEGQIELLVVNAQHLKAIPGRKTDVQDAEWIAELLRHGLLRASFVPSAQQRIWRDLTRYRTSLVQDRARYVNRLHKLLEDANLKLAAVASDVTGVSARAMLQALLAGQTDPQVLAELAQGSLRAKHELLVQALRGVVKPHHRFLLSELLTQIDGLDEAIGRVSAEIEDQMRVVEAEVQRLDTIPGVSRRVAEVILAEVGVDMARFGDAGHLAAWAGVCPGNNESAGKRKSGKTRRGSPWLKQALIEAAHGAARSKRTYLSAQFHRLVVRRGKKKALMAVGHSILVIAFHLLTRKEEYRELGTNYFDERQRQRVERRLVHRLQGLGYEVVLKPSQTA